MEHRSTFLVIYLSVIFSLALKSESARILAVFPKPSISHQVVFRPITQELVRRGHEVVVVTPDPAFPKGEAPQNLTEIDVHDFSYDIWTKTFYKLSQGRTDDIYHQFNIGMELTRNIIGKQLEEESVAKIIRNETDKFDLLLIEAIARPALVLTHFFKVPTILVSSLGPFFGNLVTVGMPNHPLLFPSFMRQKLNDLTLWDRFYELWKIYKFERMYEKFENAENKMIEEIYGDNIPPISELKNNVDMLFLNTHPMWDSNRPVPPNVIYMGGLHQKPEKELPQDLKNYLDNSKNGVIFISYGTNVQPSFLPPERIQMLVKVFSELPYDVLWKWDKDVLPGQSKNIRIGKWFPQSDMLRHPKMKLFITQGGLQSTDEAITAGVPLLGMPMLGDQWFNVEQYVKHKIGKRLDMEVLTEAKFKEAILSIIEDNSYKQNIKNLRAVMMDNPIKPLDHAMFWIEHVLRHGGAKHLRSPAANITWSEFIELPLLAIILSIALTIVAMASYIAYYILKYSYRLFSVKQKVKNN